MAVRESIRSKVETERRRLQRACAVLECLQLAFEEELDADLGDVAATALELVLVALAGLDSARLKYEDRPEPASD